jgi:uncharacterized protein YkwD
VVPASRAARNCFEVSMMRTRTTRRPARSAALLLLLSGCLPAAQPRDGAPVPVPGPGAPLAQIEREVQERVNAYRASRGLAPLRGDPGLTSLARDHSARMARGERPFGHDGFEDRVRAARAGRTLNVVSENVATNNYPENQVAARVVVGWVQSSGHRRNLEGSFDIAGVGVARSSSGDYFITQLYAASR